MATFFGEVLPVTNRAYDETEDDTEPTGECSNPFTVTYLHDEKPLKADRLIFAFGQYAAAYSERLLPAEPTPVLTLDREVAAGAGPQLYRLAADTWLCRWRVPAPVEHHYWLPATVLQHFENAPTVIALDSSPMSNHFSRSDIREEKSSFLVKCLTTTHFKGSCSASSLEPPNVLNGAAAAVLSWCQLEGVGAVLLHLFTTTLEPDADTLDAWHAALSELVPALSVCRPAPRPPPTVSAHMFI